uniref:Uncharacterized protein n=2 Tax=Rhodnius prolixus TaxID=13249 RepID=T1HRL8_RHOPR
MTEDVIKQPSKNPGISFSAEEIPVHLRLDDIITDDEIKFMNLDQATLDDIRNILEIIKNKKLEKLLLGCEKNSSILNMDVNTLKEAGQETSEVIMTSNLLEEICSVIGYRIKRTLKELFLQNLPITLRVSLLKFHRARYLKKISIRHCQIGDYGCKAIFKRLSPFISHIDLTDNNISKKGVHYIASAIREQNTNTVKDPSNTGLQYLCLNCNPIRSAGLNILVDTMVSDFCLKSVELRNCGIEDIGNTYILALVNSGLEVFDLRGNPVAKPHQINKITKLLIQNNPPEVATFKWSKAEKLYVD